MTLSGTHSGTLPPPRDATAYHHWYQDKVRFSDLDAFGHANSLAVGAIFESARVDLLRAMGVFTSQNSETVCALARLAFDYPEETHLFEAVRIGQRVSRIGTTSFTLHSALFVTRDGQEVCTTTCEAVCVLINSATHRPTPILPEARKVLEHHA